MNTKLIFAAAALAVSMSAVTTNANANHICAIGNTCIHAEAGAKVLGRVKLPPKALGRVQIPAEPAACVRAREATKSNLPKAPLLVKICLAQGGNPNVPADEMPPIVISQPVPAPAPAPQPSGSNVDPGDYENASNDGISCGEGRNIVRHSGFNKVRALECISDVFT